jgi:hypothetical protein
MEIYHDTFKIFDVNKYYIIKQYRLCLIIIIIIKSIN